MFNSWYVSLAVTHGARCFGDDELLCFIGMAAILANRSTRNRNKNGVCFASFGKIVENPCLILACFYTTREKYKDIFHS